MGQIVSFWKLGVGELNMAERRNWSWSIQYLVGSLDQWDKVIPV